MAVETGLERCLADPPAALRGRIGLLLNQASVDRRLRLACDLFEERLPGRLTALFSPQHGLWGEQQANMIESGDTRYPPLDLPVYSLYSATRTPTPEMLRQIDCLVIDLQDVGTRVYTFVWTMMHCLKACAAAGVTVIVLDRPNPVGGIVCEGPLLADDHITFVGGAVIPLRHGLTIGELAQLVNAEHELGVDLHVVPMQGWRRSMLWPETGLPFVLPSPNMQRFETSVVYPGQVLLEGVTLSEGRGTTLPFEFTGAPGLDPFEYVRRLRAFDHPGLALRPTRFVPTFDKWKGESCGGVALHVVDAAAVRSVATTVALIAVARQLAPERMQWLPPPYEYETVKPPIDILFGNPRLRMAVDANPQLSGGDVCDLVAFDEAGWRKRARPYLRAEYGSAP